VFVENDVPAGWYAICIKLPDLIEKNQESAMTLDRARKITAQQLESGSEYNRKASRLLLGEFQREHA